MGEVNNNYPNRVSRSYKNNHKDQQKEKSLKLDLRKITGYMKSKEFRITAVTAGLVLSMVAATVAINTHNKEEALDHAAEVYANTMSRNELNMIASGYSPAVDEVISDLYETQRIDGNNLIRDISGLNGLYEQSPSDVTYENYAEIADEYKAFVKEFAWNNVGQYCYSEDERNRMCFYEQMDNADGFTGYCIALDQYDRSSNSFATNLQVTDKYFINSRTELYDLVDSYVHVMDAMDSQDLTALRKYLTKAVPIINDATDRMYWLDDRNKIHEEDVDKVQEHLIAEINEGDYKITEDKFGRTNVILTDIHPDDRDDR